jgi:hypothetical protein
MASDSKLGIEPLTIESLTNWLRHPLHSAGLQSSINQSSIFQFAIDSIVIDSIRH